MRALLWAIGLGEYRVKKSLTPGRIEERHAVITQVHQALPERAISQLCELLQVSRSWYYEKQTRPEGDEADVELRDTIERIILDFPGYGYRRVTHALKRTGWIVNHKRVLRQTAGRVFTVPVKAALCPHDGLAASLCGLS